MTADDLPPAWQRDERGVDAPNRRYIGFVHESGRVRVYANERRTDGGGYRVAVNAEGREGTVTIPLRIVSSLDRVTAIAVEFANLFDGAYGRSSDVEEATRYAADRVRPPDGLDPFVAEGPD